MPIVILCTSIRSPINISLLKKKSPSDPISSYNPRQVKSWWISSAPYATWHSPCSWATRTVHSVVSPTTYTSVTWCPNYCTIPFPVKASVLSHHFHDRCHFERFLRNANSSRCHLEAHLCEMQWIERELVEVYSTLTMHAKPSPFPSTNTVFHSTLLKTMGCMCESYLNVRFILM